MDIKHGALILQGPSHYQVLQQVNGSATVQLSGVWEHCPVVHSLVQPRVHLRAVRERDGMPVVDWFPVETGEDKTWRGAITLPVGGPYRLETCMDHTGQRIEWSVRGDGVRHLCVGDLYVIAGQSNAVGYGKDPVEDAPRLGVHILRNDHTWDIASHPLGDNTHSAHLVNNEAANPGHSPWLHFAKRIMDETGYPIGLIQSALGGSPLEMWHPQTGALYQSMMASLRLAGGRVRGMLWYQGETEACRGSGEGYAEAFAAFAAAFRRDVGDPDCPIITVQLNRSLEVPRARVAQGWSEVREAQRQAARQGRRIYLLPAFGAEMADGLHNSSRGNMIIGERAAQCALEHIYGKQVYGSAPDVSSAAFAAPTRVVLTFDHVYRRMDILGPGGAEQVFLVEDEGGEVPIRHWTTDKNTVTLHLARAAQGRTLVSALQGMDPRGTPPTEMASFMPILAFRRVEVK